MYYEAVILIIAFILAGNALEARAKRSTATALKALAALQPPTARVVRGGDEVDLAVEDVIKQMKFLSEMDKEKILGGNAMRMFGLNGNGARQ